MKTTIEYTYNLIPYCVVVSWLCFCCREDAVRLGFFIGGFTGSYHLLNAALIKWRGDAPAQNCVAAGTAAGQPIPCSSNTGSTAACCDML